MCRLSNAIDIYSWPFTNRISTSMKKRERRLSTVKTKATKKKEQKIIDCHSNKNVRKKRAEERIKSRLITSELAINDLESRTNNSFFTSAKRIQKKTMKKRTKILWYFYSNTNHTTRLNHLSLQYQPRHQRNPIFDCISSNRNEYRRIINNFRPFSVVAWNVCFVAWLFINIWMFRRHLQITHYFAVIFSRFAFGSLMKIQKKKKSK